MSENEDRIDEIIRSEARGYNSPPATPRDEMWMAIQAARQAPGPRLHVTAGGVSTHTAPRRFTPRFAWMGMAAAAVLLIATGIGIGRYTSRAPAGAASTSPVRVIAEAPAPVPGAPNDEIGSPAPSTSTAPSTARPQPSERSREEIRRSPVIVGKGGLRRLDGTRVASNPTTGVTNAARSNVYQVATVRHLADAEAFLTSYTLGPRDAGMNAQFADWAKGLLSNTRLLLDSPAGDDPRRAKLLQDLEAVLAQIVQLSPDARAEDRELVKGSIEEGHVMTRLRTAIPAGNPREILENR